MSQLKSAVISAKASTMSSFIMGNKSVFQPTGHAATSPVYLDETLRIQTANGVTTPVLGSKISYNLPKNSTLIYKSWHEFRLSGAATRIGAAGAANPIMRGSTVTVPVDASPQQNLYDGTAWVAPIAGVYAAGTRWPQAEYVKNVGDLIVRNHTIIYGNTQLQYIPGLFHPMFRRVCCNDVNIEATNAMVLGNLPPSGNATAGVVTSADAQASTEGVLINAFYEGCTLYTPCEEYYFTHNKDEAHMPEAYALELQVQAQLATLGELVNTITRDSTSILVAPTVLDCALRYQEITLSAAEKENRLRLYSTPEGLVNHILDLEWVEGIEIVGTAAGGFIDAVLPLQSLRKDMAELIFMFNRASAGVGAAAQGTIQPYAGSVLESSTQPSLLFEGQGATQAQGFSSLIPIDNFQIYAANNSLTSGVVEDFWNRAMIRKFYHPDSQISDPIYVASFSLYPQDYKNATGHMSPSVLGNLQLRVRVANPGAGVRYLMRFANHCHNALQSCRGAITGLFN